MISVTTNAELEAHALCIKAGVVPIRTDYDRTKAVAYVLALADRIKNERAAMTMLLACNNGMNELPAHSPS